MIEVKTYCAYKNLIHLFTTKSEAAVLGNDLYQSLKDCTGDALKVRLLAHFTEQLHNANKNRFVDVKYNEIVQSTAYKGLLNKGQGFLIWKPVQLKHSGKLKSKWQ